MREMNLVILRGARRMREARERKISKNVFGHHVGHCNEFGVNSLGNNMASSDQYPDHLNPFGDAEEDEELDATLAAKKSAPDDYPDHLDPFGADDAGIEANEDYDDSLNPFGDHTDAIAATSEQIQQQDHHDGQDGENNAFSNETEQESEQKGAPNDKLDVESEPVPDASITLPLDSVEPPKPLPRTKRLLKKEQNKKRLQELQQSTVDLDSHVHSMQTTTSKIDKVPNESSGET